MNRTKRPRQALVLFISLLLVGVLLFSGFSQIPLAAEQSASEESAAEESASESTSEVDEDSREESSAEYTSNRDDEVTSLEEEQPANAPTPQLSPVEITPFSTSSGEWAPYGVPFSDVSVAGRWFNTTNWTRIVTPGNMVSTVEITLYCQDPNASIEFRSLSAEVDFDNIVGDGWNIDSGAQGPDTLQTSFEYSDSQTLSIMIPFVDNGETVCKLRITAIRRLFNSISVNGSTIPYESLGLPSVVTMEFPTETNRLVFNGVPSGVTLTFDDGTGGVQESNAYTTKSGVSTVTIYWIKDNIQEDVHTFQFNITTAMPTLLIDGKAYTATMKNGMFYQLPAVSLSKSSGFTVVIQGHESEMLAPDGGELYYDTGTGIWSLMLDSTSQAQQVSAMLYSSVANFQFIIHYSPPSSPKGDDDGSGSDQPDTRPGSGDKEKEGDEEKTDIIVPDEDNVIVITEEETVTLYAQQITTDEDGVQNITPTDREMEVFADRVTAARERSPDEAVVAAIHLPVAADGSGFRLKLTPAQSEHILVLAPDAFAVLSEHSGIWLRGDGVRDVFTAGGPTVTIESSNFDHNGFPGRDFSVLRGAQPVSEFSSDYAVRLEIPYTLPEGQDAACVVMQYIEGDNASTMTECHYDQERGMLVGSSNHLSKYGVAYRAQFFADVPNGHPAGSSINFLAARGVILASGDGRFYPDQAITRADYLQLLTNALSALNVGNYSIRPFLDVPPAATYAPAANWAYLNNIVTRDIVQGAYFRPQVGIRREDLAVVTGNTLASLTLRLTTARNATEFEDTAEISPYARGSVDRLAALGILQPTAENRFHPAAACSRGDAAIILAQLLSSF